jgi:hypothetical protein
MRDLANDQKIREFMLEFARSAREHTRVYFTGGATAVLIGWRDSTIDVDIKFEPELDELFRSLPQLKESLQINVELASPGDFIPLLPGWQERSQFIETIGKASYYHYDFYSQALSKIERGHVHDLKDAEAMIAKGLVDRAKLLELFRQIEPQLYKYPAIDPKTLADAVSIYTSRQD